MSYQKGIDETGSSSSEGVLPTDFEELTAIRASDILASISGIQNHVQNLLSEIESSLSKDATNGISVKDYMEARKSGNVSITTAFEQAHEGLDGKTEGEALPFLLDAQAELQFLSDCINQRFFSGTADLSDLSSARDSEESQIQEIYRQYTQDPSFSWETIRMDNHFRDVLNQRVQDIGTFVSDIDQMLHTTIQQDANGYPDILIQDTLGWIDHLSDFRQFNALHFDGVSKEFADTKMKMQRLTPLSMRMVFIQKLDQIQGQLRDAQPIRNLLQQYDPHNGLHPSAGLMQNVTNGLYQVYQRYGQLLQDVRLMNILTQRHQQQIVNGLDLKRNARSIHGFLNTVQNNVYPTSQPQVLVNHIMRVLQSSS